MSTLFACPPNHPRRVSADCCATCEPPECQISLLNSWIVNSFGQNATLLTGHSMVEQLLGLIGLSPWHSTHRVHCAFARPQRTQMWPCLLSPIDWDDASGCSPFQKAWLVNSFTIHLSSRKCSACVCIRVKGWHPTLNRAHQGSLHQPVQAAADKRGHRSR